MMISTAGRRWALAQGLHAEGAAGHSFQWQAAKRIGSVVNT
jgi:hypothetical protein